MVEITAEEPDKVKRMKKKKNEDSLRDLQENIKHTIILIVGVPEEKEKKKMYEKIFWRDYNWKFPQYGKENSQ